MEPQRFLLPLVEFSSIFWLVFLLDAFLTIGIQRQLGHFRNHISPFVFQPFFVMRLALPYLLPSKYGGQIECCKSITRSGSVLIESSFYSQQVVVLQGSLSCLIYKEDDRYKLEIQPSAANSYLILSNFSFSYKRRIPSITEQQLNIWAISK